MSQEWIQNLAEDIKQKSREPAESYAREQRRLGIAAAQGKGYFTSLVRCLEEDFEQIRAQLQGDIVSTDTSIQTTGPGQVKLTRNRFPWFDALLSHDEPNGNIILDYAQGRGVPGDTSSIVTSTDRRIVHFAFHVGPMDTLTVREAFSEANREFDEPADLARHIVELLFKV
jgi:hypothetical protein